MNVIEILETSKRIEYPSTWEEWFTFSGSIYFPGSRQIANRRYRFT